LQFVEKDQGGAVDEGQAAFEVTLVKLHALGETPAVNAEDVGHCGGSGNRSEHDVEDDALRLAAPDLPAQEVEGLRHDGVGGYYM